MRLFLGIELPERVRAGILSLAFGALSDWDLPSRSYVRLENLHLTIKFVGELPDDQLPGLCDHLRERKLPLPLSLRMDRVKCLPQRGPIRILSTAMAGGVERLRDLHAEIEFACQKAGVPLEGRPFTPHVTFARIRSPLSPSERRGIEQIPLPGPATEPFPISEVVLFQSHLEPSGPRYVPVARFSQG
jgi:2'-5' RNA ligase